MNKIAWKIIRDMILYTVLGLLDIHVEESKSAVCVR